MQKVQSVTLALTLPISCHICLGKVRHPVICSNNHVFCSMCIQSWLKNSSQCPTCRIPITSENPVKEVLGGTDGTENCDNPSTKRHLRKTRLELLHKEYEEEIESLQKEIEDFRSKNLSLESQLKTVLDPVNVSSSSTDQDRKKSLTGPESEANSIAQQEWATKLKAATEIYKKTKADVDKLKEANRKLRVQNSDLVRENLHLKAEVDSRSPHKFGRFTVAALQSKVDQYEREMNRLKRALERSDKYIEDMELEIEQLKERGNEKENVSGNSCSESPPPLFQAGEDESSKLLWNSLDVTKENRIIAMRRSLSKIEQPSVSQLDNAESMCSSFSWEQSLNGMLSNSVVKNRLPADNGLLTTATVENNSLSSLQTTNVKQEGFSPPRDESEIHFELPSPCTPSTSLGGLHLHSTDDEASPLTKKKSGGKRLSYLRKLCFDDANWRSGFCDEKRIFLKQDDGCINMENFKIDPPANSIFWDAERSLPANNLGNNNERKNLQASHSEVSAVKSENTILQELDATSTDPYVSESEVLRSRTSSETSMDTAYQEKISELDFMLDETENLRNPHCTPVSEDLADLDISLTSELAQCTELMNEAEKRLEQKMRQSQPNTLDLNARITSVNGKGRKSVLSTVVTPITLDVKEESDLFQEQNIINLVQSRKNIVLGRSEESLDSLSSEKKSFHIDFSSPILSASSHTSDFQQIKPYLLESCLIPENEKVLGAANNNNQTSKRKLQNNVDIASPSKSSKRD
ncbi:ORC ubiquitin ligase 1 [Callorhinchus milii]|uniref:ORC ubiquitin ligase 1 n=1 Tax=Callorhinchus milii TaxID=7868 RepID=UPI001C3F92F3|nr:ORC ubiquitin ligase 1 [Callorhinchus milii]